MSEIQRWEVGFSQMNENDQGEFITWNDHLAAMQAARPQPKFKVGDRVTWKRMQGSRIVESSIFRPYNNTYEYYIKGTGKLCLWEDDLELYVPPVATCGCPGGYAKVAEVPTPAAEVKAAAIKAAVEAERVRCLVIIENIQGCAVGRDGYLYLDPDGELVSRSRVETAIRWVKVK